jgi:hypothetical protein
VIAAGLVTPLFEQLQALPIDVSIAYGLAKAKPPDSPLYESFVVLEVLDGLREKVIRERMRELRWSTATEVKKRGWSGEPEKLHKQLKLAQTGPSVPHGVIVIARVRDRHVTLICERTKAYLIT